MRYLDDKHLSQVGFDWDKTIDVIHEAVKCLKSDDFAQPVKPYLRYNDLKNRIIAMPAYVGGKVNMSGIKWISSFPDNINHGIPRAHSVVILNQAETGVPEAIINTPQLSIIRTASVSGYVIRVFLANRSLPKMSLGIIGFGPIGQYHLNMCFALLKDRLDRIFLYDIKKIDQEKIPSEIRDKVTIVDRWEDAYTEADIFITCTVSKESYIDKKPKSGSLHLNVSLRDYKVEVLEWFREAIIVDDWEEVCREETDIENMHLEKGLNEEDTKSMADLLPGSIFSELPSKAPILFNPMGLAVFDIAIGNYFLDRATQQEIIVNLD